MYNLINIDSNSNFLLHLFNAKLFFRTLVKIASHFTWDQISAICSDLGNLYLVENKKKSIY